MNYKIKRKREEQRIWINTLFEKCQFEQFFGGLTIKMENGLVCRVVKEQSIIPPNSKD